MVFSSVTFLFFYLPVVLTVYHLLFAPVSLGWHPAFWRRVANGFLVLVSLTFYFWGEGWLLWILCTSMLIDYVCALGIAGALRPGPIRPLERGGRRSFAQRLTLIVSLLSNLAFLGYFKYFNFGVDSYNQVVAAMGLSSATLADVARVTLPLGISFYTFQSMSYTIDVYRGEVAATRNLIDFTCCITAFPHLVAGPIIRYRDLATQATDRTIPLDMFVYGIQRFAIGMGKKVLIANTVAQAADKIFALPTGQVTCGMAWLAAVTYTLQIYFDFSGYSDMAVGLGRMLGFEFTENFNYPYAAHSMQDFWRRWHISLSSWLRDYVYIPLGGSRGSTFRTYFNLVTVFFLCGLWHGACWSFVFWGLYHGLLLVLERVGLLRWESRLGSIVGRAYTLLAVMVGWILFRSESVSATMAYLRAMVGLGPHTAGGESVAWYATTDVQLGILAGLLFATPVVPNLLARLHDTLARGPAPLAGTWIITTSTVRAAWLLCLLAACSGLLVAGTHNPFIYFRF